MKSLIVFASKYGASEKCANLLSEKLNGDVTIINLRENKNINLSDYDKIIVGASVYAGSIQAEVKDFCAANSNLLLSKPFALFLSCMSDGKEEIKSYVERSFSNELINHATVIDSLGYGFNFNKMNFFEKLIIKMVVKSKNKKGESDIKLDGKINFLSISNEKIAEFANKLNS
jgi:menaquinone-dependent protoporphyrinogen oxidase